MKRSLKDLLKEYSAYILINILLILILSELLMYVSMFKKIDATYSIYGCLRYCYPNYFLGASTLILLTSLSIARLIFSSKHLDRLILSLLLITPVTFYTDLFTRKGVYITVYPLVISIGSEEYRSVSIDFAQISIIILLTYTLISIYKRHRSHKITTESLAP